MQCAYYYRNISFRVALKYTLPTVIPPTEELCEFIGAFIGDGNLYQHPRTGQLTFTGDINQDLEYYQTRLIPIALHCFGLKGRINSSKNRLQCKFYSQSLLNLFKNEFRFIPGPKTFSASIPVQVLASSSSLQRACVRGLFDTDGGVGFDRRSSYRNPYVRVNFVTSSPFIVQQVSDILRNANIRFTLHTRNNVRQFQFQINGVQSVQLFCQTIGFSNPRHTRKLRACHIISQ